MRPKKNNEKILLELKQSLLHEPSKNTIVDVLTALREEEVTASLLKKTELGIIVGRLKKSEHKEVALMAKSLIQSWKDKVSEELKNNPKLGDDKNEKKERSPVRSPKKTKSAPQKNRTVKTDGVQVPSKGNPIREKSIEVLYAALSTNTNIEPSIVLEKALEIESFVDNSFPVDMNVDSYREKIRSLFCNLKDPSNSTLRIRVLDDSSEERLSCKDFVLLSPSELKSKEREEEDKELQNQNLFLAQGFSSSNAEAETDQFKCGKCKQRKCRYYQMQTRSADEPMVIKQLTIDYFCDMHQL